MKTLIKRIALLSIIMLLFASCSSTSNDGFGDVNVKLTDSPFPFSFVSEANVGFSKIEIKNDSTGEYITVYESTATGSDTYNLLDYQNGRTTTVKTSSLPVGTYKVARVTFNNATVKMDGNTATGNSIFNFSTEAQGTYEEEINPSLEIKDNTEANVLVDIDVNKTFQFQSNNGFFSAWINAITNITGCTFHPTFRVCDLNKTGEISGIVTVKGTKTENASVSLTVNNKEITANSQADGSYKFLGIQAGTYTLTVLTPDGSTANQSVIVEGNNKVTCNLNVN